MCDTGWNPLKDIRDAFNDVKENLFGKQKMSPDPAKERLAAEAAATNVANLNIVENARRKRAQNGRIASDINILASGASAPVSNNVLGSGGA